MGEMDEKLKRLRVDAALMIVLIAPYFLNDIVYASQPSAGLWLAIDQTSCSSLQKHNIFAHWRQVFIEPVCQHFAWRNFNTFNFNLF